MINRLIICSFLLLFVGPFIFLLSLFKLNIDFSVNEVLWALQNSVAQSFLSAFFSILLGCFAAFGLLKIKRGWLKSIAVIFCLLPNFVPPLFTLISVLNFLDPFPMGLTGIVIAHVMINFGLVAILISHLIESKLGALAEACLAMGTSRIHFLSRVFWPLLRKDFLSIGLFVFSVCFASFSIPLVVGGGRGTTLEVLIYEKIRLSSDWGAALFLSLLQSAILWTMSLAVRPHRLLADTRKSNFKIIESSFGLLVFICIMCAYFIGYGQGLLESMTKFSFILEVWDSFWRAFFGSWFLGVLAGSFTLLLLLSLLWLNSEGWFDRFFAGYWAPSTSLTGFAFLLIAPNEGIYAYFKIAIAFVVLNLNSFYRMGWQKNIQQLKKSREVATVLGADRKTVFFRIELPQVFKRACFFSGLMAVWMIGDFGLSRILAYKDFSLALMSETYLSSYRMAEATLLSFFVLIVGLLVLTIFWSLSYVYDRKFKLSL